jgi:hypothetical protein
LDGFGMKRAEGWAIFWRGWAFKKKKKIGWIKFSKNN